MGLEEVVNISRTRHRIRSSEVLSEIQDSTIHSILSGKSDQEDSIMVAAEVASPPDKDHRICRALELRTELKVLKDELYQVQ